MSFEEKNYYESIYPMAGLNHSECIGSENLGWTKGVLSDGVPFEAEMWMMDGRLVYIHQTIWILNRMVT